MLTYDIRAAESGEIQEGSVGEYYPQVFVEHYNAGRNIFYYTFIEGFEALGQKMNSVEVRCHDLKDQGADGLIGMSFLKQFDWCLHPGKQVISVK